MDDSITQHSIYSRQQSEGFPFLTFFKALEKDFRVYYLEQNQWRILSATIATLFFFAILPWVNVAFFSTKNLPELWLLIFGIICPMLILVIAAFLAPALNVAKNPVVFFSVLVCGWGTIAMMSLANLQGEKLPYEVLILVTVYSYFFSGLLFMPALFCSLSIFLLYLVMEYISNSSHIDLLNNMFNMLGVNVVGILGCYFFERTMRKNFLHQGILKEMAQKDALTGIYNRRYFEENYERIWRQASREEKYLTVMLVDVDYFKNFNDSYGHVKGDLSLKRIALALNALVKRPLDLVARYGGEEFVVVCYNARKEFALSLSERMRKSIEELAIPHCSSGITDHITLSVGAAVIIPGNKFSAEYLLEVADKALYEAKRSGRNKATIKEFGNDSAIAEPSLQTPANQWAERVHKQSPKAVLDHVS